VYNNIGLRAWLNIPREAIHWQFGEMEFGEMKRNTSNWSYFCMLLRRAGLTASAGLSCFKHTIQRCEWKFEISLQRKKCSIVKGCLA